MSDRFDWNEDKSVVIRPQPAIAIQGDERGDLLLRQEGQYWVSEDQFFDIRLENVLGVCKAMLREAGLHQFMIVPVSEIEIVGTEGNRMVIPAAELEKLDRIAEVGRQQRNERRAARTRPMPARPAQPQPRDPKATERKRRQRQKEREAEKVTPSRIVTGVTERDTMTESVTDRRIVTMAPRLPAELDLLQHGGAKQPVG
jgi:hypothetical protein